MKVQEKRSWQGANDDCVGKGGHLVSVHSDDENEFIRGNYWIGLLKVHKGGQRHWSDGTPHDYDNWKSGGKIK